MNAGSPQTSAATRSPQRCSSCDDAGLSLRTVEGGRKQFSDGLIDIVISFN